MSKVIWTIKSILDWGSDYFEKNEIESPRLNIELLLCNIMKCKRLDLYMKFDKPLSAAELKQLKSDVKRRASNEPLQYILGEIEFYACQIKLNNNVLIPRPETEEMIDIIGKESDDFLPNSILDIGTGSGCIAISLAKIFEDSEVFAIDIDDEIIKLAQANAIANEEANSEKEKSSIKFFNLNILDKVPKKKFNLIVTNPPYIASLDYDGLDKELKDFEPRKALTDEKDGYTFYKRFADIFFNMLEDDGKVYMEFGFGQSEIISNLFSDTEFEKKIYKDAQGIDRVLKLIKITH